jgi:hypothetical protein
MTLLRHSLKLVLERAVKLIFIFSRFECGKRLGMFSLVQLMRECQRICIMKYLCMLITLLIVDGCHGQGSSKRRLQIVGGNEVGIEDFPYQGGFLFNGKLKCGCSVISRDCILTAGEISQDFHITKRNKIHFQPIAPFNSIKTFPFGLDRPSSIKAELFTISIRLSTIQSSIL